MTANYFKAENATYSNENMKVQAEFENGFPVKITIKKFFCEPEQMPLVLTGDELHVLTPILLKIQGKDGRNSV